MRGDRKILAIALAVILLFKLPLLAVYGPTEAPDSGDYIVYADAILSGALDQRLTDGFSPRTYFRVIGYPATIAAAKLISGQNWRWLVVAVQISLSLVTCCFIFRFMRSMDVGPRLSACGSIMHGISLPLVLDQMILSDSIASSLLCISFLILATNIAERRSLSLIAAISSGIMIGGSCLVREANFILVPPALLITGLVALIPDRARIFYGISIIVCLLLPSLAANMIYRAWNLDRSGAGFVTTAAQSTMPQALLDVGRQHPEIFDASTPFGSVALDTFQNFTFDEVWILNRKLFEQYGMTADKIATAGYQAYFSAWKRHPVEMLYAPIFNFRLSVMRASFQPLVSIQMLDIWHSNESPSIRYRGFSSSISDNPDLFPLIAIDFFCSVCAVVVILFFVVLTPWMLLRLGLNLRRNAGFGMTQPDAPRILAGGCLFLVFVVLYSGYSLVHIESRYLTPGIGFATAVGLSHIVMILRKWNVTREIFKAIDT